MLLQWYSRAEIRVQFRHVPGNLYRRNFGTDLDKATNELVLRVQPDEAIYLKINNKVPGLGMRLDRSDLNLLYRARYENHKYILLTVSVLLISWRSVSDMWIISKIQFSSALITMVSTFITLVPSRHSKAFIILSTCFNVISLILWI